MPIKILPPARLSTPLMKDVSKTLARRKGMSEVIGVRVKADYGGAWPPMIRYLRREQQAGTFCDQGFVNCPLVWETEELP